MVGCLKQALFFDNHYSQCVKRTLHSKASSFQWFEGPYWDFRQESLVFIQGYLSGFLKKMFQDFFSRLFE